MTEVIFPTDFIRSFPMTSVGCFRIGESTSGKCEFVMKQNETIYRKNGWSMGSIVWRWQVNASTHSPRQNAQTSSSRTFWEPRSFVWRGKIKIYTIPTLKFITSPQKPSRLTTYWKRKGAIFSSTRMNTMGCLFRRETTVLYWSAKSFLWGTKQAYRAGSHSPSCLVGNALWWFIMSIMGGIENNDSLFHTDVGTEVIIVAN